MSAYDWELRAACRQPGTKPDAWYPTTGQSAEPARAICQTRCAVREDCLEAALAEEHPANPRRVIRDGIRGGLTPEQRAALQRARTVRERAAATAPTT